MLIICAEPLICLGTSDQTSKDSWFVTLLALKGRNKRIVVLDDQQSVLQAFQPPRASRAYSKLRNFLACGDSLPTSLMAESALSPADAVFGFQTVCLQWIRCARIIAKFWVQVPIAV
eukprot:6047252-Amphidinium_carterae.2